MKPTNATIQMTATEQHYPLVLFIVMYKVVLTFSSVVKVRKCHIQINVTDQCFPVVHKVGRTFDSVDEIFSCNYSNNVVPFTFLSKIVPVLVLG